MVSIAVGNAYNGILHLSCACGLNRPRTHCVGHEQQGDQVVAKEKLEVKTSYEIYEMTDGGTMKKPQEDYYGGPTSMFYGDYESLEEAEEAILEDGQQYTGYYILPITRLVEKEEL